MATRVPAINTGLSAYSGNRTQLITWSGLLNGDDGTPFAVADFDTASIQLSGTLGVGGTLVLEGTNDGTTYTTLQDAQLVGAAISLTALSQVILRSTAYRQIRPRVTAGDGSTNLIATLLVRSAHQF